MPSFFMPPRTERPAPLKDAERLPIAPSSPAYRSAFLGDLMGVDVVVAGVGYRGGRWNGPLSATQVSALTAAGYAARIVTVNDASELPGEPPVP